MAQQKPNDMATKEMATESVVRGLEDRRDELATETANPAFSGDMHDDPDAPNPESGTGTEATEAVSEWRVSKSLLKLRAQVNAMAPNRSKASDGTIGDIHHCGSSSSTSDHCPRIREAGIGVVAAMDITHDPSHGCNAATIASSIHASRDSRIKYIIWNRKIASSSAVGGTAAWTWRNYNGSNPHDHHVHVSVKPSKPLYDSESAWTVSVSETTPVTS